MGGICSSDDSKTKNPPKDEQPTKKPSRRDSVKGSSNSVKKSKCPHCNEWVASAELHEHSTHCPLRKVSCQHPWCTDVMPQKDLDAHMVECAKKRQTRCAKCGDMIPAVEIAAHRSKCVTINCQHCNEEVIPRLVKYCPERLFRNVHYTKGPFATEFLRHRFFRGDGAAVANNSFDLPAAAAAAGSGSSSGNFPVPGASSVLREEMFDALKGEQRSKTINFSVARVQHLWRWARARCLIEEVLFRLIYKEQDNKKESFSVFARTKAKYFDYDESGGQSRLRLVNTPTAQPTQAEGAVKGHYFPTSAKDPITPEICDKVVQDIASGVKIPYYAVYRVFNEASEQLKTYPNVQSVPTLEGARYANGRWVQGGRANVVGDMHGQLSDLLYILQQNGLPHEGNVYVFNGDFVDRGARGFEVFFLLCTLFLTYPGCVFLNRGNHEVSYMNEEYGFDVEVQTKYDRNVFKLVQRCFNALPLATLIGKKVFVVHAGPPRMPDVTIAEINLIDRHREIPLPDFDQPEEDEIFQDLLWSDPMEKRGWVNSERGVGVLYGPDVSGAFMQHNGLTLIIRSHETFMRGYEEHHGGKVVTVFSCSNYDGPDTNYGSFINLVGGSDQPSFHTYSVTVDEMLSESASTMTMAPAASSGPGAGGAPGGDLMGVGEEDLVMTRTMTSNLVGGEKTGLLGGVFWFTGLLHNRHKSTREDVLRSMRESIFERRHKLLAYFSKIDRTRKGTVWKMEWTEAMRNVLNLECPWFFLRQYLCDTDGSSPRIRYVQFLRRFRTAVSQCYLDDWVLNAVSELHSLTKLRKNAEAVRALLAQPFINYNSFCSIFKKIDYNLSDNALFELFVDFDTENRGIISGADYLQFLEGAAADVEARRSESLYGSRGPAGGVSDVDDEEEETDDLDTPGNKKEIAWDLDSMNELERIMYTSRSSLHTVFRLPSSNSLVDKDAFHEGMKNLIRSVKKLNAITGENIDELWEWIASENDRAALTLEELFLCFLVRDFVLLQNRLSWLGDYVEYDTQVSPFFTMSWLVHPAPPSQRSNGTPSSAMPVGGSPPLEPTATPGRPGGNSSFAAAPSGAVSSAAAAEQSSNSGRSSPSGRSDRSTNSGSGKRSNK